MTGVLLASCPVLVWNFFKPVRILAPALSGFQQVADGVYVDDLSRAAEAQFIHAEAVEFVQSNVGQFKRVPRVIFCTTTESLARFGLNKQAGHCWFTFGIVIAPRGWHPHYVRHEMIHHLQVEQLGILKFNRLPQWFIEGMAYSMSEDPRPILPEPWQGCRTQFDEWIRDVDVKRDKLWERAARL